VISRNGLNINQIARPGIGVPRAIQLYSKNSHRFIRLHKTSVDGSGLRTDPNTKLTLESAGFGGQVRLRSLDGTRYLCIASHGSLVIK
ncbi:hypothetical protein QZH41_009015, partial [Actinostola sp. cb2023]